MFTMWCPLALQGGRREASLPEAKCSGASGKRQVARMGGQKGALLDGIRICLSSRALPPVTWGGGHRNQPQEGQCGLC